MSDLSFLQDVTHRRQSLTWFVSLKSFQTNGSQGHAFMEKSILTERTSPARRSLLAFWRYPYVCDGGGSSDPLWAKALPLQYSKIYERLIVTCPLMSWQTGNRNFILLPVQSPIYYQKEWDICSFAVWSVQKCVTIAHSKFICSLLAQSLSVLQSHGTALVLLSQHGSGTPITSC